MDILFRTQRLNTFNKQWLIVFLAVILGAPNLVLGETDNSSLEKILPDSMLQQSTEKKVEWVYFEASDEADLSHFEKAFGLFELAEKSAQENGFQTLLLKIKSKMGSVYLKQGLIEEALKVTFEGQKLARTLKDTSMWIRMLFWESAASNDIGEFERAKAASEKTIGLAEVIGNETDLGWAYSSLGEAYRKGGHPQKADSLFHISLQIFEKIRYENPDRGIFYIAIMHANLAQACLAMDKLEEAQMHLNEVFSVEDKILDQSVLLEVYFCQVQVWEELDKFDQAESKALEMMAFAVEKDYLKHQILYANWLSNQYEKRGEFENGLAYHKQKTAIKDQIGSDKAKVMVAVYESRLGNLALVSENQLMGERQKRQFIVNVILASILLLILFGAWIVYRNFLKTKKLNAQLKDQNHQLDAANQEINSLIGIVAHDLQAPISQTLSLVTMSKMLDPNDEKHEKIFSMMEKSLTRGENLIRDVLTTSSLESNQRELELEPVDLNELMHALSEGFQSRAKEKDIVLQFECDGLTSMTTEASSLNRILENLLSNAIKFSHSGTQVSLSVSESSDAVLFKVKDEGPGISTADQAKMFQKFQRLTARPTGGEDSTGLGLAIVKTLVERLGGTLQVDSELGVGTEFAFSLPKR